MEITTIHRGQADYPVQLTKMQPPPDKLYVLGAPLAGLLAKQRVAVVGSRRMTGYGKQATVQFTRQLVEQGIVIISGLALGVDAQAHTTALDAGGLTIAVLPSPLDIIAPSANLYLARRILENGGALVSTYAVGEEIHKGNFVARNELVAALSDAILITEGATNSGARHTATFAQDMSISAFAVPGNINSPLSAGPNHLIESNKANLATSPTTILKTLGIKTSNQTLHHGETPEQQQLIDLLQAGVSEGAELLNRSQLPIHRYNQTLTMLEINGAILPLGANRWGLA